MEIFQAKLLNIIFLSYFFVLIQKSKQKRSSSCKTRYTHGLAILGRTQLKQHARTKGWFALFFLF
jgi:hypothetical protein